MTQDLIFSKMDLRKLIVPLIIEQILAVTVGMADVMMVSSAGEEAVSGVSLVDMINVLLINIFAALATGGAVVSSQFLGAKDRSKACNAAGQLLFISFILSMLITIIVLFSKSPLLRLLFGKIENDVMQASLTYLTISALSYPFIAVYNSCAALFRSMGNSKVSMYTSAGMNVINIAGNAVFVFGFHMGVAGVALSSLISRFFACLVMLFLLNNPLHEIHVTLKKRFHPSLSMIKTILYIGIPSALESSMFQLGRVIVVSIIAGFGTVQIAANAVANNLDAFDECVPGRALSLAMITRNRQMCGSRRLCASQALYQKAFKNNLSHYHCAKLRHSLDDAVNLKNLQPIRCYDSISICLSFDSQRLCHDFVASFPLYCQTHFAPPMMYALLW